MPSPMQRAPAAGLLILQGNRLEALRDVVVAWLSEHPLDPLDEEVFVVQSTAAAEWLKRSLATSTGVCAAARFDLPARFLWRTYRAMLGSAVDSAPTLDADALTWRLMRLLPSHLDRPSFAPVARYLAGRGADRRLSLARRLADLFDQYQVYRPEWLDAWESGRAVLVSADGRSRPLPDDARWQAELWRTVVADLPVTARSATRPRVHRAFVEAVDAGRPPANALPRRVVVFGAAYLNAQTLEALAALSTRLPVLCAIPNPCRYHWADVIEGRELLQARRQRLPTKREPLATVSLDAMHLHAPPLLAAWGRQGRDFMRLLDAVDDSESLRERFDLPRIDVFDDGPGATLLGQVQAAIRDLVAPIEQPRRAVAADDRSIVFTVAHGVQREVEALQDALLARFADGSLKPRDVVVMVPDIEVFAPAVRAVFGRYGRDDPRFVPFDIADLRTRGSDPLVVALEWLLTLADQRIGLHDVRDLLEVPAAARRAGIDGPSVPGLFTWLEDAGVRWGLDVAHRADLGLGAAGDANTWRFGLRRMLLGYASGASGDFAGVAPFDEVGGLETAAVGALIALVERLERWRTRIADAATPVEWAARCRALLADFFAPVDDRERLTVAVLNGALGAWLDACESADFRETVPLAVVREAWLGRLDGLDATRRFFGGGVTFCTMMPLRSVPFEVVCLLGMNERDFPRRQARADFDLLALPGQRRPGDRSRHDDDRYLMLEALLSARRALYVSWSGRNARDDVLEPPSVLVSQLRDHLASCWTSADGGDVLAQLTVEHPLQPFSRRYFEGGPLATSAREWRVAHDGPRVVTASPANAPDEAPERVELGLAALAGLLRNPVRVFFETTLGVRVRETNERADDDEPFALTGLASYQLRETLITAFADADDAADDAVLARALRSLKRSGALPLFARGDVLADDAASMVRAMRARWRETARAYPRTIDPRPVRFEANGLVLADAIAGLRSDGRDTVRVAMRPSRLLLKNGRVSIGKLCDVWLAALALSASAQPVATILIGCDATVRLEAPADVEAAAQLERLLDAWTRGLREPLPFAVRTAVAWVASGGNGTARAPRTKAASTISAASATISRCAASFDDFEALRDAGFADLGRTSVRAARRVGRDCRRRRASGRRRRERRRSRMSDALDPIAFPLQGSRLIEASAGTGKTWTIATLYVRLVLGHGDAATGFGRPLDPSQILVMTFTIAATRELSDRVRRRLLGAARAFRGDPGAERDAFLDDLLAAYPDEASRAHAAWRLAAAADAMDDATILTIDAWVQKVLREHAFDSGSPLDETLEPDQDAMLVEASRDYWRREVYPLSSDASKRVEAQWADVDALTDDVRKLIRRLDDDDEDDAAACRRRRQRATRPSARCSIAHRRPAASTALKADAPGASSRCARGSSTTS